MYNYPGYNNTPPGYNYLQPVNQNSVVINFQNDRKNIFFAYLLYLTFGIFGVHHLYLGRPINYLIFVFYLCLSASSIICFTTFIVLLILLPISVFVTFALLVPSCLHIFIYSVDLCIIPFYLL